MAETPDDGEWDTTESEPPYTHLPVPGLPGVRFRELELALPGGALRLLGASAVDVFAASAPGEIPYWAVAWPAGLALARHLAARVRPGERVLELGCGVGAAALGAALAGADVLATDNQPPALRLARMNARRCRLPLRAAAADWRAWPLCGRFDRVVGSDVTYEPSAFAALLAVLRASVAPGGEALLTDPGRLTTTAFLQEAAAAGWRCGTEPLGREGSQPVFLYRLRRAG